MDASGGEMEDYLRAAFTRALDKVKEIAEG
jgi:hypothetical protein